MALIWTLNDPYMRPYGPICTSLGTPLLLSGYTASGCSRRCKRGGLQASWHLQYAVREPGSQIVGTLPVLCHLGLEAKIGAT